MYFVNLVVVCRCLIILSIKQVPIALLLLVKNLLEKKKEPEPKDAKRVKRKEKINSLLDSIHNPNRPVNDDKPEGLSSGVAEGTVVDDAGDDGAVRWRRLSSTWERRTPIHR